MISCVIVICCMENITIQNRAVRVILIAPLIYVLICDSQSERLIHLQEDPPLNPQTVFAVATPQSPLSGSCNFGLA